MPEFRFTNTQAQVYVDRALIVEPGDVVDWDTPPDDGHWEPPDVDEHQQHDGERERELEDDETEHHTPDHTGQNTEE